MLINYPADTTYTCPRISRLRALTVITLLAGFLMLWLPDASQANAVNQKLTVDISTAAASGSITVSLTNSSSEHLSVLSWGTPFEATVSEDMLRVVPVRKGFPFAEPVAYIGRHVRRAVPGPEAFLELGPGETRSATIAVSDYYAVESAEHYTVSFVGEFKYRLDSVWSGLVLPGGGVSASRAADGLHLAIEPVRSNAIMVPLSKSQFISRAQPPVFDECSAAQRSDIVVATDLSETKTREAVDGLEALTIEQRANSPRYRLWFGEYELSRFDTVLRNLKAVDSVLRDEVISYNCDCNDPGVYGFVFINAPYDVFLCPLFWSLPDERVDTIVHEISHFNVVAGTDDIAYGPSGSQALANSDPDRAIMNADNYSYFVSNQQPQTPLVGNDSPVPLPSTPGGNFVALEVGEPFSGAVSEGQFLAYSVDGISNVTVESVAGDADLFVYRDPALTELICRSSSTVVVENCPVDVPGTVYIIVVGHSDATFNLVTDAAPVAAGLDFTVLEPGQTVTGSVVSTDVVVYQVDNAESVTLTPVLGETDLYVFNSTEFNEQSLVCQSLFDSGPDRCQMPEAMTHYLVVYGVDDSEFQLETSRGPASPGEPDQPVVVTTTVDADADPTVPDQDNPVLGDGDQGSDNQGGSGGSGSSDWIYLVALALAVCRRYCRTIERVPGRQVQAA